MKKYVYIFTYVYMLCIFLCLFTLYTISVYFESGLYDVKVYIESAFPVHIPGSNLATFNPLYGSKRAEDTEKNGNQGF